VKSQLDAAKAVGRQVLVYVGATWCEPCRHFHEAVEKHLLDAEFPKLTLVSFDLDRDRERLDRAGYSSRLIPLFAVPMADGHANPLLPDRSAPSRALMGSVKGEEAVGEITPRLRALLAESQR